MFFSLQLLFFGSRAENSVRLLQVLVAVVGISKSMWLTVWRDNESAAVGSTSVWTGGWKPGQSVDFYWGRQPSDMLLTARGPQPLPKIIVSVCCWTANRLPAGPGPLLTAATAVGTEIPSCTVWKPKSMFLL